MFRFSLSILLLLSNLAVIIAAPKGLTYDVTCSAKEMTVTLGVEPTNASLYVQNLRGFKGCHPEMINGKARLNLPLDNFHQCGTTRMVNKYTGQTLYYNRLVMEENSKKEVILVKCVLPGDKTPLASWEKKRPKRNNDLPPGFVEAEDLNITNIVAHAPTPYLNFAIRQNGHFMDTITNVQPGTPLEMVVFLDSKSSSTYGILTSYLKVTDGTPEHDEVIVMNGCSIDPYIFGNFQTPDEGKSLYSKFRAFKFPDTNYVLFVGTVNVCLKHCRGVQCGSDQIGYGRRKREIPAQLPYDPNKLYEVEMTAVLRVEFAEDPLEPKKGSVVNTFRRIESRDIVTFNQRNAANQLLCPLHLLILVLGVIAVFRHI